jgi:hypothetical protein
MGDIRSMRHFTAPCVERATGRGEKGDEGRGGIKKKIKIKIKFKTMNGVRKWISPWPGSGSGRSTPARAFRDRADAEQLAELHHGAKTERDVRAPGGFHSPPGAGMTGVI